MVIEALTTREQTRWVMAPLMIGIALSPLNVVFTSIALPTMRTAFGVTVQQASWIGTAYFIPSVAFMPLQGYLGRRWGARRVYVAGLLILSAGGVLAAFARSFGWLLVGRAIQGVGWSALYPLAMVMIRTVYAPGQQGAMMGLWESAVGFTTVVAPVAGGAMVQFYGWPLLYIVMSAAALAGVLLTLAILPTDEASVGSERFDWSGAVWLTLVVVLALVAISAGSLLLGVLTIGAAFVWWWRARSHPEPFVRPQMLANLSFIGASMAANLRMLTMVGALIALPLFFEDVQGLLPAAVGSLMVIYSLWLFLTSWPGGRWSDRSGARVPGAVGFTAMIVGLLLLAGLGATLNIALTALALTVRGIGAGLSQAPYAKAAVEAVDPADRQVAAGLYGTIRYSGLALGTALVGAFLQARLEVYGTTTGAVALPAYRELWFLLALLGALGLVFTWLVGRSATPDGQASGA